MRIRHPGAYPFDGQKPFEPPEGKSARDFYMFEEPMPNAAWDQLWWRTDTILARIRATIDDDSEGILVRLNRIDGVPYLVGEEKLLAPGADEAAGRSTVVRASPGMWYWQGSVDLSRPAISFVQQFRLDLTFAMATGSAPFSGPLGSLLGDAAGLPVSRGYFDDRAGWVKPSCWISGVGFVDVGTEFDFYLGDVDPVPYVGGGFASARSQGRLYTVGDEDDTPLTMRWPVVVTTASPFISLMQSMEIDLVPLVGYQYAKANGTNPIYTPEMVQLRPHDQADELWRGRGPRRP